MAALVGRQQTMRVLPPRRGGVPRWAGHVVLALPERTRSGVDIAVDGRVIHPGSNRTSARKACQLGHLAIAWGRFSLTLIDGVA
ncbi:MAG TPA: hypothetical protein VE201_06325 [Nitrospirales bacterium]|nr:hypothetical protein [Nitrospirales bacterium]